MVDQSPSGIDSRAILRADTAIFFQVAIPFSGVHEVGNLGGVEVIFLISHPV